MTGVTNTFPPGHTSATVGPGHNSVTVSKTSHSFLSRSPRTPTVILVGGAFHRPDLRRISERQPPFPPRRPLRSSRTSISISWTAARRSAQQLQLLSTNWLCAQPLKRHQNCTRAADPRHCARPIMHSAASTEFSLNPSQDCMTFT